MIVESSIGYAFVFYGCSSEESVRPELFAVNGDQGKDRAGLKYSIVECDYDYVSTRCVDGTGTIVES